VVTTCGGFKVKVPRDVCERIAREAQRLCNYMGYGNVLEIKRIVRAALRREYIQGVKEGRTD